MNKFVFAFIFVALSSIAMAQEGIISKVVDDKTVEINLGSNQGVMVDDKFKVYGKGEYIHPATGLLVVGYNIMLGEIIVKEVSQNTSKTIVLSSNNPISQNDRVVKQETFESSSIAKVQGDIITKVIDNKTVEINLGSNQGVKVDDKFMVYGKGEFVHPATGKLVTGDNIMVGEIIVKEVFLNNSKANVISSNNSISQNERIVKQEPAKFSTTQTIVTNNIGTISENPRIETGNKVTEQKTEKKVNPKTEKKSKPKIEKIIIAPSEKKLYLGVSTGFIFGQLGGLPLILSSEFYPVKKFPFFVGYKLIPLVGKGSDYYDPKPSLIHSIDIGCSPFKNSNKKNKGLYFAYNIIISPEYKHDVYSTAKIKYGITLGYQAQKFFIESNFLFVKYFTYNYNYEYYNNNYFFDDYYTLRSITGAGSDKTSIMINLGFKF